MKLCSLCQAHSPEYPVCVNCVNSGRFTESERNGLAYWQAQHRAAKIDADALQRAQQQIIERVKLRTNHQPLGV